LPTLLATPFAHSDARTETPAVIVANVIGSMASLPVNRTLQLIVVRENVVHDNSQSLESCDFNTYRSIHMKRNKSPIVGDVSAQKAIIAEHLEVHGDVNLTAKVEAACVSIVRMQLDSSYWESRESPRTGWKSLYPFEMPSSRYFYLNSHLEQQDPVFDVLLTNKRDYPILLLAVGFFIYQTADVTYAYGAFSPRTFRILREDLFTIEMPKLKPLWPSLPKSYPPNKRDVTVNERNEPVGVYFEDPIGIESRQPYRFGLKLLNYIHNMPNNVLARIIIHTDEGDIESDLVYLFTY
jgi:hypothetical protein